jgi:hypothetical protein
MILFTVITKKQIGAPLTRYVRRLVEEKRLKMSGSQPKFGRLSIPPKEKKRREMDGIENLSLTTV